MGNEVTCGDALALSYGAGVETTAILALVAQGELPKPGIVVFADTGAEWPETYDYVERWARPLLTTLGRELTVVANRQYGPNLYDYFLRYRAIPQPFDRACTTNFKVGPLGHYYRERGVAREWVGFSLGEQGRAARKRPIRPGIEAVFPLIEFGVTRADCPAIIRRSGLPVPPKSSCVFCAFQHPSRVGRLWQLHPMLFERVGLLEDKALERAPGHYIFNRPWRTMASAQMVLNDDWDYGCADGYCLR